MDNRSDLHAGSAGMEPEGVIECAGTEVYGNAIVMSHDVISQSQPGTDEALSTIGILQQIDTAIHECQALILAPTPQLAIQFQHFFMSHGEGMNINYVCTTTGTKRKADIRNLEAGCHVVIGTPDRVLDMIRCKNLRTENVKMLLFKEPKKINLRPKFEDQIQNIFCILTKHVKVIRGISEKSKDTQKSVGMEPEGVIECAGNEVYGNAIVKGQDVITQSQPGTDEALSTIGILQQIDTAIHECQALILAPTRQLAVQIQHVFMSRGEGMNINYVCTTTGTKRKEDIRNLEAGCHVVIGTPDRVLDMIRCKNLRTENVKLLMFKEPKEIKKRPNFKDQIQNIFCILPKDVKIFRGISQSVISQKSVGGEDLPKNCCMLDKLKRVCITEIGVKNKKCLIDIKEYQQQIDTAKHECQALILANNIWKMANRSDLHAGSAGMEPEGVIECAGNEVYGNAIVKGQDVSTQTQPGSGQFLSFSIGVLQQIDTTIRECQVLILAPTRELATQIQRVVMSHGEGKKINSCVCIGGTNVREDIRILEAGCHLVIGTPGRVIDMINRKKLLTENVKLVVLEESENLMRPDFKHQIQNLVSVLPKDVKVIRGPSKKSKEDLPKNRWMLDKLKRVYINKGGGKNKKCLIDIMVYPEMNGKILPSKKKGLSLTIEEWEKLLEIAEKINEEIAKYQEYRSEIREGSAGMETEGVVECVGNEVYGNAIVKDQDVITQSQPGNDETSSTIGILQQIDTAIHECEALILAPTPQLAIQIQRVVMSHGEGMKINSCVCIGGTNVREDIRILEAVIDMINRKKLRTENVKLFVLDEILMRPVFKDQIQNLVSILPKDVKVIRGPSKKSKEDLPKNCWMLDKLKRVCITKVGGKNKKCLIAINEYQEKEKKGKGVSLEVEEWEKLLEVAEEINKEIAKYQNYRTEMREGSAAMETEGVVESRKHNNTSYTDKNLREKLLPANKPKGVQVKSFTSPKVYDNWREPRSSGNGTLADIRQRANISSVKGDDIIAQTKSGTNNFGNWKNDGKIDNRSDGHGHEEPTGMEPKGVHESTWDNTPYTEVNLREKLLVDNDKPTAMQQCGSIICVKGQDVISQAQNSGGCKRIDIQNYDQRGGVMFPRRTRVTLTTSEWKKLIELAEEINKVIGEY